MKLIKDSDKRLRTPADACVDIDDAIKVGRKMIRFCKKQELAIGMSAVQLGIMKRITVMEMELGGWRILVNPEMVRLFGGTSNKEEGCMSFPGIVGKVKRYRKARVKYIDESGNEVIKKFIGRNAIVVQHEQDHNNGIVCIDKMKKVGD